MGYIDALDWPSVAAGFAASVALTPLVRALSRHYGAVAQPRRDRWHQQPTALLGGIAIFASVVGVCLAFGLWNRESLTVLGCASFLFVVGLVDDFLRLKPYQKLIAQVMAAA